MKIALGIEIEMPKRTNNCDHDYTTCSIMVNLGVIYIHSHFELVRRSLFDIYGSRTRINCNVYYGVGSEVQAASSLHRHKHFNIWRSKR